MFLGGLPAKVDVEEDPGLVFREYVSQKVLSTKAEKERLSVRVTEISLIKSRPPLLYSKILKNV